MKQGDGRFHRKQSEFRNAVGDEFPAEPGRYHLIVQYACPWAHRTLVHRALLGLDASVDVVSWRMQPDGSWVFEPDLEGCTPDRTMGASSLQDIYHAAAPDFAGIGTVPVLWDTKRQTIVNNESREIIRMMNTAMAPAQGIARDDTLLPPGMEAAVDAMIDANYESINNAVYKCGFARTQEAYDENIDVLFDRLAALEAHMEGRAWLLGDTSDTRWGQDHGLPGMLTEADVCLWTTLLRFDAVYHTHFKCNVQKIAEMPHLQAFVERLFRLPGVAETVHWDHIKQHYYWSHTSINPFRIVPKGPPLLQ